MKRTEWTSNEFPVLKFLIQQCHCYRLRKRPGTEKAEETGETEVAEEAKEVEDDVVDPKMCIEFVLGPPRDQRLASITELYCDDEFSTSLPENNIHLSLSDLHQPLHYHDQQFLTGKYLLPFSLPSGLQDSLQDVLQESSLDWCEGSHLWGIGMQNEIHKYLK